MDAIYSSAVFNAMIDSPLDLKRSSKMLQPVKPTRFLFYS
jgi:hypothetical protein